MNIGEMLILESSTDELPTTFTGPYATRPTKYRRRKMN